MDCPGGDRRGAEGVFAVVERDSTGQRRQPDRQPGGGDQLYCAAGVQSGRRSQGLRRDAGHLCGAVFAHHQDTVRAVRAKQPAADGVHRPEGRGVPQVTGDDERRPRHPINVLLHLLLLLLYDRLDPRSNSPTRFTHAFDPCADEVVNGLWIVFLL